MLFAVAGCQGADEGRHDRLGSGDANFAALVAMQTARLAIQRKGGMFHDMGMRQKRFAEFGQVAAARAAGEEGGTQRVFKGVDAAGDGGLVQPQLSRSSKGGTRARNGQKDADVVPVVHPSAPTDMQACIADVGVDR